MEACRSFHWNILTKKCSQNSNDQVVKPAVKELEGLKVGIPAAFLLEECPKGIQNAWTHAIRRLECHGAIVEIIATTVVSPKVVKNSIPAYYVIASAEASSNLTRYDGLRYGANYCDEERIPYHNDIPTTSLFKRNRIITRERQYATFRAEYFGAEVTRRIICGTSVLSSDRFHLHYEAATKARTAVTRELTDVLKSSANTEDDGRKRVDLMMIPTALTPPPRLEPLMNTPDCTEVFANDIMTVPVSLAGLPSISVPVPTGELKIRDAPNDVFGHGLQIFGPRSSEEVVLKAAFAIQH